MIDGYSSRGHDIQKTGKKSPQENYSILKIHRNIVLTDHIPQ
jgi:hypothetical protein